MQFASWSLPIEACSSSTYAEGRVVLEGALKLNQLTLLSTYDLTNSSLILKDLHDRKAI